VVSTQSTWGHLVGDFGEVEVLLINFLE